MDKGLEGRKDANTEFMLLEFKMVWEDRYDPTDRDPRNVVAGMRTWFMSQASQKAA